MHIPYRGASPMVTDLLGGQIDLAFATLPSVAAFLSSGRLRALAVTSLQRSAQLPTAPTFAEAGVKGYEAEVWYGVFAPAGTSASVIDRLHAALRRATETDDFRERAASEGLSTTVETPQDTQRILREDESKWRKVVREQSLKMD
jgi:tripartite-type tricarboxylate transporter receptor subunit TctC